MKLNPEGEMISGNYSGVIVLSFCMNLRKSTVCVSQELIVDNEKNA